MSTLATHGHFFVTLAKNKITLAFVTLFFFALVFFTLFFHLVLFNTFFSTRFFFKAKPSFVLDSFFFNFLLFFSHRMLTLLQATFESHHVGMRIRKTHDIPVVHELVNTPSGEPSPAALAGVPPTAVLVGVEGERTLRLGYEEAIGR